MGESTYFKKFGSTFHRRPFLGCEHFRFESDEYWACCIKRYTSGLQHQVSLPFHESSQSSHFKAISELIKNSYCILSKLKKKYQFIHRFLTNIFIQQVGTCKMGPSSDPDAVVNAQLQVHGIRNLRIVDASIMPILPSAHTNAVVLMIGEKGADIVKDYWRNLSK